MALSLQVRLLMNRDPDAKHVMFQTRDLSAALVALMNLIFAYGESSVHPLALAMALTCMANAVVSRHSVISVLPHLCCMLTCPENHLLSWQIQCPVMTA